MYGEIGRSQRKIDLGTNIEIGRSRKREFFLVNFVDVLFEIWYENLDVALGEHRRCIFTEPYPDIALENGIKTDGRVGVRCTNVY